MKLSIRLNGQDVDLPSGTRVPLDLVNPYLVYDQIPGSRADVPVLPPSPRNRRIFDFFDEPQAGSRLPEFFCEQFYEGELIRAGYFLLTEADDNGYKGTFTDRLGLFFGDYQTRLLPELPLGSLALPTPLTPVVTDGGDPALCFPAVVNPDFYGTNGGAVGYTGRVNEYSAGAYSSSGPKVPMVYVTYLLKRLAALTGTHVEGDLFTHPQWKNLVVYNTRALDGATDAVLARHLPDLTLEGLLLELRKVLNLALTFDSAEKRLRVDFWEPKLARPALHDWTGKAVAGEVKTVEQNARLQLGYELDSGDALMKDKPAEVADYLTPATGLERSGTATLKSKFSTLLIDAATGLATARQAGVTELFNQGANRFAPRLLLWHGVTDGQPRALPTLGPRSLYWNGADGLAARCWPSVLAQRRVQFYLKKEFRLTETDLVRLDFSRKIHCEGVDYLVAMLTPTLPIRDTVPALLVSA